MRRSPFESEGDGGRLEGSTSVPEIANHNYRDTYLGQAGFISYACILAPLGSTPGCIPREREPVAQGPCPFGPSLSTRFGWSVLTTVQEHVRVPTPSDLAHRSEERRVG